jgi:NAD-dependent deacetylase
MPPQDGEASLKILQRASTYSPAPMQKQSKLLSTTIQGMPDARLVELLRQSRRILVFCGAGISTASGIPDFRGPNGVWTRRRPVYYDEFLSSEDARVEYWDFKLESWDIYRHAEPNAVHYAIVELERARKVLSVVTQNIDGLHRRAGTSPDRLIELHGTDLLVECLSCHETSDPGPHLLRFKATRQPPRCACRGLLKPATISFGQPLRTMDWDRAASAAAKADLVIALGSTLSVYPAAGVPLMAAERGTPYVIVNRGESEHDSHPAVTLRLDGDLTEIVPPAVAAALQVEPAGPGSDPGTTAARMEK